MSGKRIFVTGAVTMAAVVAIVGLWLLVGPRVPVPVPSPEPRYGPGEAWQPGPARIAAGEELFAVTIPPPPTALPPRPAPHHARVLLPACTGDGHPAFEVLVDDAAAWFGRCWARVPRYLGSQTPRTAPPGEIGRP